MFELDRNSFAIGLVVGQSYGSGGHAAGKLARITVKPQPASAVWVAPAGYYGLESVEVLGDENLLASNIKYGVEIFGVTGTYAPTQPKLVHGAKTITQNGTVTYLPPDGYVGASKVTITVKVPVTYETQSKSSDNPGTTTQWVYPDEGYLLSSVSIPGDSDLRSENIRQGVTIFGVTGSYIKTEVVDAVLQNKSVVPGRTAQYITPDVDSGYNGLWQVTVAGSSNLASYNIKKGVTIFGVTGTLETQTSEEVVTGEFQNKTVTPTRSGFTVYPDSGYDALSYVTVKGDNNLTAGNIAKGKSIFGVYGTYVSPMAPLEIVPTVDTQEIVPANEFEGFSKVIVYGASTVGDFGAGFEAGKASRDEEVALLNAQIESLKVEAAESYNNGYNAGYEAGVNDIAISYKNLDEVKF